MLKRSLRAITATFYAIAGCSSADPQLSPSLRTLSAAPSGNYAAAAPEEPGEHAGSAFGSPLSWFNRLRGSHYALDDVVRQVEPKTIVKCDPSTLVAYKGTSVPYAGAVLVEPAFIERLARFEALVNRVATEVYGRPPTKLLHAGAYSCRTSRNRSGRLSEHALGNALDVVGFSFGRATKEQQATTPKPAQAALRVTILQHWNAERAPIGRLHREFLRKLSAAAVEEQVFRVALGPSHPGHADHLHFDMSPWNYTHL